MKKNYGIKGPVTWMAGHSVAANLLMVLLLVGGLIFGGHIKKEIFPDFEADTIAIKVSYPGASPEEVEKGVILAVEEAIYGLEGIKEISSTSVEGLATVIVEIIGGEDIDRLAQDIQNNVARISSLPEDAEDPQVYISQRRRYVISIVLYGDQSERVLREFGDIVRDQLIEDSDITQVELSGVRDYEISIEISEDTLRNYKLTIDGIAKRIQKSSIELPGGAIKSQSGDILVRIKDRKDYGYEFGKLPIITAKDGTEILLEDIATINDGFETSDKWATYNGKPAIMMDIYRVGDQTPISVSNAVKKQLKKIQYSTPQGLNIDIRRDRSDIYRQRLNLMLKNGYIGLTLVFILLAIFLEPRLAFWVSLGIPISFFGSFVILTPLGVSINMITMFAFIVTLGIVVDDAIVVGENIYNHRQKGAKWPDASINGVKEVMMPVTFSIITNMVAFTPIFFVPGFMGKIFKHIPVVVIIVFAISLIESIFILPAHLGHRKETKSYFFIGWLAKKQQKFSIFFINMVNKLYGPFLDRVLNYRYMALSVGLFILIVTIGYIKSGRMGFELFPKIESDYAKVTLVLPFGSSVHKTVDLQKKIVSAAQKVADKNGRDSLVEGIYATIENNNAKILVYLTPYKKRPISTAIFTDLWSKELGPISGIESIKFESDAGGPGSGSAITLELCHRNMDVLKKASSELADALSLFPNVKDIDDGFAPGKQQINYQINSNGLTTGLRAYDVARQLRNSYYGATVVRQQRGRNEVKVMVRLPESERICEYNLEEMIMYTPDGKEIPLREIVSLNRGRAYTKIERRNGQRVIKVSADVKPRKIAGQIIKSLKADIFPNMQNKYMGLSYNFRGRQADQRESMSSLMKGLLLSLLVIYAMLAIPFNSYIQPLIVILAVPFGIIGAIAGHIIMGYSLCILSMFGVVALSGVVINDSLVLIDFANHRHLEGMSHKNAIYNAAIQRFRPILLTTLTTFGGLAPMIFETSRQARFLIPMAISLGFGIVFATFITLIIIPSFYLIIEDIRTIFQSKL